MLQPETSGPKRQKNCFSKQHKSLLTIDMTPMVDLGFLLVSFFIFTTTLSSPRATDLFMPNDNKIVDSSNIPESLVMTVILENHNKIFYYEGGFEEAKKRNDFLESGYSVRDGIGIAIRKKQKSLDQNTLFPEGRNGLMLLIKPAQSSSYRNVIDAIDEVLINGIKKYAIVDPTKDEIAFIKSKIN